MHYLLPCMHDKVTNPFPKSSAYAKCASFFAKNFAVFSTYSALHNFRQMFGASSDAQSMPPPFFYLPGFWLFQGKNVQKVTT
jgi:hypothetical protein